MISHLLHETSSLLADVGIETARLDAELLLAHSLGEEHFASLVQRRLRREPVAYLLGYREFWSIPIRVTPDVLIPRPETEHVIERALELFKKTDPLSILDLCTGSGCIAAGLAKEFPQAQITMTDNSPQALEVAKQNLVFASDRVRFACGDLFNALKSNMSFDLITANPPYLSTADMAALQPEIAYEPSQALDGGQEGLDFLKRILDDAADFLKSGGSLLLECGEGQANKIHAYAGRLDAYRSTHVKKDLAGIERVVSLRKEH